MNFPGDPLKFEAGLKRIRSLALITKDVADMIELGKFDQVVKPLAVTPYCQTPSETLAALATIATPAKALALLPPTTVSLESLKAEANRLETVSPEE